MRRMRACGGTALHTGLPSNPAAAPPCPARSSRCVPAAPAEGSEGGQVLFATLRPADCSVPYAVLEKNGVAFSAVDKRSNKLLTVLVR